MDNLVLRAAQRRQLESQLRGTRDVRVYQRTLAVLARGRGRTVAEIARLLCVSRQSVYRWLDADGEAMDPKALVDEERLGRPRRWSLSARVSSGCQVASASKQPLAVKHQSMDRVI